MKIILKYPWQLICCLLLILLFLQRQCTHNLDAPIPAGSHTEVTVHDTIRVHDTIPEHVPALVIHDTIPPDFPFDTLAFLADYFTVKTADDTLRGDNYIVTIRDILYRNKIQSRKAKATVNVITETVHTTDSIPYPVPAAGAKPRTKVFAGIGIGGWTDKVGFAPALALNTKKDNLYSVSYDVINRTAWFQMYWKIKLRK
jgi:hypothetical protein